MALLETFALTIATSLAKQMLEKWLGSSWTAEVSKDLLGVISDSVKGKSKSDTKKIDAIAGTIVEGMDEWVKVELKYLEKPEQRLAIEEVARTLASARIDAKMLVSYRLDSDRLRKHLVESRPEATKSFSDKATILYNRLIKESAERIVEHAAEIPGFPTVLAKESLDADDQIMETLRKQSDHMDMEAREFERRYREALIRKLDRMELFGLPRMDEITRRQRLSIAYVSITLTSDFGRIWNRIEETRSEALQEYIRTLTSGQLAQRTRSLRDWTDYLLSGIAKPEDSTGLVIQGRAGSGKTTLLQWLAIKLARTGLNRSIKVEKSLVPFFLRLREFVDTGFPVPESFVAASTPVLVGEMPAGWVHRILRQQRAAILIDGMDEVPLRLRSDLLQKFREFMAAFPGNFYAITSRPAAISSESWPEWASWTLSENFIELELLDMTLID